MALIQCPECGKEISDQAANCPTCGYPIEISPQPKSEVLLVKEIVKEEKRKDSALSMAAFLISLFSLGFLSFIGLILAIIDLSKKDSKKDHGYSTAAIVIFCCWVVLFAYFSNGKEKDKDKSENSASAEIKTEFTYGKCKVKYLRHEIMQNDVKETVLVVYYDFTNAEDDEPRAFDYYVTGKAYQNGVELESSWWHANDESKNGSKEIQKGTTLTVADSYVLGDSRDNVIIEFRPFNIWSDKLLLSLELELK